MIFNKPKNCTDFWDYEKIVHFNFIFFGKKSKIRRICKAISYILQKMG